MGIERTAADISTEYDLVETAYHAALQAEENTINSSVVERKTKRARTVELKQQLLDLKVEYNHAVNGGIKVRGVTPA